MNRMSAIDVADAAIARLEERGEDTSELRRELAFARVDCCVCCGAVVPEGRMVCPSCERGTEK